MRLMSFGGAGGTRTSMSHRVVGGLSSGAARLASPCTGRGARGSRLPRALRSRLLDVVIEAPTLAHLQDRRGQRSRTGSDPKRGGAAVVRSACAKGDRRGQGRVATASRIREAYRRRESLEALSRAPAAAGPHATRRRGSAGTTDTPCPTSVLLLECGPLLLGAEVAASARILRGGLRAVPTPIPESVSGPP